MRAKSILTLILGAFVVVAFAMVVKQSGGQADTQPVVATSITPVAQSTPASEPRPPRADDTRAVEPPAHPTDDAPPTPAVEAHSPSPVEAPTPPPVQREVASVVEIPVAPQTQQRKVVATYFYGSVRCTTCRKVESYAREAIEEGFGPQIADGIVEFRTVNVEEPQNRHYIQDYQLVTRSVVVAEEVDGAVARWVRLDQVWALVRHRPLYLNYVQDAVNGYMGTW
jgi:hypothetical protein